jgi:SAM-dependent methyltransferase
LTHADARVIDVGAGGGRIAVPLARRVRELVAVEPSESMRDVLAQAASAHGLQSIEIVASTWQDADVAPADLVFAAHVTYSVPRIEPFLCKMDRSAIGNVALVTFSDPAQHVFAPFWKHVYGEERLRLPTRAELIDVLHQLDIDPQVDPLPLRTPGSFGTPDEAFELVRRRLFVGERTPAETRLHDAMTSLTEVRDGEVWPVQGTPNEISILSWEPTGR